MSGRLTTAPAIRPQSPMRVAPGFTLLGREGYPAEDGEEGRLQSQPDQQHDEDADGEGRPGPDKSRMWPTSRQSRAAITVAAEKVMDSPTRDSDLTTASLGERPRRISSRTRKTRKIP